MEGTLEEVPLSGEGKASCWCRPSFCWFVEALTWKPAQIKTKGLVSSLCLSQSMRSDADFWKDSMWFDAGASIVKHVASFLHFAGSLCFPCVIQTASLEPLPKKNLVWQGAWENRRIPALRRQLLMRTDVGLLPRQEVGRRTRTAFSPAAS